MTHKNASIHHSHMTLEQIQAEQDSMPSYEHACQYGEEKQWRRQMEILASRKNAISASLRRR